MSKKGRPVRPYGDDWGRTSSWGGPIEPRSPMGGTSDKGARWPVLVVLAILLILLGYNAYLMYDTARMQREIVQIWEGQ